MRRRQTRVERSGDSARSGRGEGARGLPDGRGIGSVAITADETLARSRAARPENRCKPSPVPQGIVAKSALSTDNLRPSTITRGFGSACRTCSSGPGMRVAPLGFREEQP